MKWLREQLWDRYGISSEDFEIGEPHLYKEPEETGCNWNISMLHGHGTDPGAYVYEGNVIIGEARIRFNLKGEV